MSVDLNAIMHRLLILAACLLFGISAIPAQADPVGDFFKRLGRSIAPPQPPKQPPRRTGQKPTPRPGASTGKSPSPVANTAVESPAAEVPAQSASPTPVQVIERALAAPQSGTRRDLPYAVPVPGRPGFVTSPYAPSSGYVDVRGFASGAEVKDPYTGKIFLTP